MVTIAKRLQQAVDDPAKLFEQYTLSQKQSENLGKNIKSEQPRDLEIKQIRRRTDKDRGYRM